jgi:chromosome segregation ATPase
LAAYKKLCYDDRMIIVAALIAIACSAGIYFAFITLQKRSVSSVGAEKEDFDRQISDITSELEKLLTQVDGFASKGQFDTLSAMVDTTKSNLESENTKLKELEARLDEAQDAVEGKESTQQELKTAREEDEVKLEQLLAAYTEISDQAIALEQQLAQSMKNLDAIIADVELSDDQREQFEELAETLSAAGSNLRNLLMEYEAVKQRLDMLQEQHRDLEDEYTRLVEQQLGQ